MLLLHRWVMATLLILLTACGRNTSTQLPPHPHTAIAVATRDALVAQSTRLLNRSVRSTVPLQSAPTFPQRLMALSDHANSFHLHINNDHQHTVNPSISIDRSYPIMKGGSPAVRAGFNLRIVQHLTQSTASFVQDVGRTTRVSGPTFDQALGINATLVFTSDRMISIQFEHYVSTGGPHAEQFFESLNYTRVGDSLLDLTLNDLFLPNADYLMPIAAYITGEFHHEEDALGRVSEADVRFAINHDPNWNITKNGLAFAFPAGSIVHYAAGPQIILVPYSGLEDLIPAHGLLATVMER